MWFLLLNWFTLVPKLDLTNMATGGGLTLPEPLQNEDTTSWFKWFKVCSVANGWDDDKKRLRLPTLLRGRAWAIFDSLGEETDIYDYLKAAILGRMYLGTEEDKNATHECLSQRQLCHRESVHPLSA